MAFRGDEMQDERDFFEGVLTEDELGAVDPTCTSTPSELAATEEELAKMEPARYAKLMARLDSDDINA